MKLALLSPAAERQERRDRLRRDRAAALALREVFPAVQQLRPPRAHRCTGAGGARIAALKYSSVAEKPVRCAQGRDLSACLCWPQRAHRRLPSATLSPSRASRTRKQV